MSPITSARISSTSSKLSRYVTSTWPPVLVSGVSASLLSANSTRADWPDGLLTSSMNQSTKACCCALTWVFVSVPSSWFLYPGIGPPNCMNARLYLLVGFSGEKPLSK